MSYRRKLARLPILGPMLIFGYRFKSAFGYFVRPLRQIVVWLFTSREWMTYTYDLEDANKAYLTAFVADITNRPFEEIAGYIRELDEDQELREHVRRLTRERGAGKGADSEARYGRRLGWYAFVRALKPRVVLETGVDKGLGACVLTAAIRRNSAEGFPGDYYGTDINPEAGFLLAGPYAQFGKVLYGDSIESLANLDKTIDLMVNDSDHSAAYEAREYATVEPRLSPTAIILGDNSHVTDKLFEFARMSNRNFQYFQEKPRDHWYPGAGIGVAFKR